MSCRHRARLAAVALVFAVLPVVRGTEAGAQDATGLRLVRQTVEVRPGEAFEIVVTTVIINFFLTHRGSGVSLESNIPLRWFWVGALNYGITCLQCAFQVTPTFQQVIHFTDWVVGHAHMVMFGVFSFWIFGMIEHLWPKLVGREWWSERLRRWAFWPTAIGLGSLWFALHLLLVVRAVHRVEIPRYLGNLEFRETVRRQALMLLAAGLGLLFGTLAGYGASDSWRSLLLWLAGGVRYGLADPALGRDLGFYVADLPALSWLQGFAVRLAVIGFATTALFLVLLLASRGLTATDHVDGARDEP